MSSIYSGLANFGQNVVDQAQQQATPQPSVGGSVLSGASPAPTPAPPDQTTQMLDQSNLQGMGAPAQPQSPHPVRDLLVNFASNFAMNLGDYFIQRGGGANPRTAQNFQENQLRQQQLQLQKAKDLQDFQRQGELNKLTAQQTAVLQQRLGMVPADANIAKVTSGQIPEGTLITPEVRDYLYKQAPARATAQENSADKKLGMGYNADGTPKPIDQLSVPQQFKTQAIAMKQSLDQARLDAANADPNTPAGRVALRHLAIQEANARSMMTRANASAEMANAGMGRYLGDYFGVDLSGNPLPGMEPGMGGLKTMGDQGKLTSTTRTMIETAPKVQGFVNRINTLIDQQQQQLGPAAGRWSEFMAGKVGAPNPDFTKLRTDVGLLQTLLMRMHVGARGGEYIMKHFQDLIDSGKQSPENLKAALGEIGQYAQDLQNEGTQRGPKPRTQFPTGTQGPPSPAGPQPSGKVQSIIDKYK